jgi:hypothetical protein
MPVVELRAMERNGERLDSSRRAPSGVRRKPRVRARASAALVGALAVAGIGLSACGGRSADPGVANVGSSSTTTTLASASAPSSSDQLYRNELKYAECMRAHGQPDFPDPSASGTFSVPAGTDRSSPAFAACQKLLPGGAGGPGSGPPPTAAALAQMLKVSQCMRRHGIADFPDPRTTAPALSPRVGELADRDGVILVFPPGFDQTSPQFTQAAAACGFKVTNH